MHKTKKLNASFTCIAPAFPSGPVAAAFANYSTGAGSADPGGACVNIQEGLAVLAHHMNLSQALHSPVEPPSSLGVPYCTNEGACEFKGGGHWLASSGGRWAQTCDFYSRQQGTSNVTSNTSFVGDRVGCLCSWLHTARGMAENLLHPSGVFAANILQHPLHHGCSAQGYCAGAASGAGLLPALTSTSLSFSTPSWMLGNVYTTRAQVPDKR